MPAPYKKATRPASRSRLLLGVLQLFAKRPNLSAKFVAFLRVIFPPVTHNEVASAVRVIQPFVKAVVEELAVLVVQGRAFAGVAAGVTDVGVDSTFLHLLRPLIEVFTLVLDFCTELHLTDLSVLTSRTS